MTIEDFVLRLEGLTDEQIAKVHQALQESVHTIANIKVIIQAIKHELPRLERTLATVESILATINANQRRFQ